MKRPTNWSLYPQGLIRAFFSFSLPWPIISDIKVRFICLLKNRSSVHIRRWFSFNSLKKSSEIRRLPCIPKIAFDENHFREVTRLRFVVDLRLRIIFSSVFLQHVSTAVSNWNWAARRPARVFPNFAFSNSTLARIRDVGRTDDIRVIEARFKIWFRLKVPFAVFWFISNEDFLLIFVPRLVNWFSRWISIGDIKRLNPCRSSDKLIVLFNFTKNAKLRIKNLNSKFFDAKPCFAPLASRRSAVFKRNLRGQIIGHSTRKG